MRHYCIVLNNVKSDQSPHTVELAMVPGHIGQVSGDRAYDTQACYESVLGCTPVPTLAPRRNARCSRGPDPPPWRSARNATIRAIGEKGRYGWRLSSGCTRQSVAENAVSRFKALFGGKLFARTVENQHVEALVKCAAMNRMMALGMPESVRVL